MVEPVVTSVTVTVQQGTKTVRHLVDERDEHLFAGVPDGKVAGGVREERHNVVAVREAREAALGRFHFGAIGQGRGDQIYRTLGTWEVVAIKTTFSEHPEVYGREPVSV